MYYDVNIRCFVNCVRDLLDSPEVQSMRALPHHPGTSCYEHSVFVAYVSFRLARRWGPVSYTHLTLPTNTSISMMPGTSPPTTAISASPIRWLR